MSFSISKITDFAIRTLGELIKNARIDRGLSQKNLAERLNISRHSVIALEKGDSKVAIGVVFEAATIVGIPLLAGSELELKKLSQSLHSVNAVLPKRVRTKNEPVDDNF